MMTRTSLISCLLKKVTTSTHRISYELILLLVKMTSVPDSDGKSSEVSLIFYYYSTLITDIQ